MKPKNDVRFLNTDITLIEKELEQTVHTDETLITDASLHLLQTGKRIRPVFVLLAAKFGHYNIDQIKHVAVALELIHMASLVHDDVIDDADKRRGKKKERNQQLRQNGTIVLLCIQGITSLLVRLKLC